MSDDTPEVIQVTPHPIYDPGTVWASGETESVRLDRVHGIHAAVITDGDPMSEEGVTTSWAVLALCEDESTVVLLEIPSDGPLSAQRELAQKAREWITEWVAYRPTPFVDFRLVLVAIRAGTTVSELVTSALEEIHDDLS